MRKYALFFLLFLIMISYASALESLGTFKRGENVRVVQTCSDASYINISSISTPDSEDAVSNIAMTSSGNGEFYYYFNLTDTLGRYDVRGISDGCEKTFAYYFDITPSGFAETLGFYFVLIVIIIGVIILGFSAQETWFIVMGGMALVVLGVYSINNGIAGFRDTFMTWAISLFQIGIGTYLSIVGGLEKMQGE